MAGIFADEGISGTSTKKRDEFNRMIRKCRQKKIDLILTKSISRFARNTVDCLNYIRALKGLGIGVYFEKEKVVKNTGQLPMYLVENNHPAILTREKFKAVQTEMARRKAAESPSKKNSSTGRTCYASKYALSERLVCGECGTLYRRCTWTRNGQKKVVWRCVSRLDYGTQYCKESPTMEEGSLQRAILAAINSVMSPKKTLILRIADAMTEEVVKAPDATMTLGEIRRRLEALEAEFEVLFNQSVDANQHAERFQEIAEEIASLKEQREKISAQLRNQEAEQDRMRKTAMVLDRADHHLTEWSEETIRQLVHTVKVISADQIKVYLHNGGEIDWMVENIT